MSQIAWIKVAMDAAERGEKLPLIARLAAAIFLVLLAYIIRVWAWPVMQAEIPYVTFFPAAMASVFFFGRTAGIVTSVLSFFICWYYLLPTLNSWNIGIAYGSVALSFFVFAVAVNIFLIEAVKAAHKRLEIKNEETALLAREINHRVKNLFTVVRSMIRLSGRNETDPQSLISKISGRIDALAVSHDISQGRLGATAPTFNEISRVILQPYKDNNDIEISGGTFEIDKSQVTPFGLILHELATNAVKYGALSVDDGKLELKIQKDGEEAPVVVLWNETTHQQKGANEPSTSPDLSGFGSMLISQSIKQLGGQIERTWKSGGLTIKFHLPMTPQ